MDIRLEFGQRVRELRARSGMSQELLAFRAGLDRTYISGVERGERNVSLVNIEKIAGALHVTMTYLFSDERFSTNIAYQSNDFTTPFTERFNYKLDHDNRVLAFQVNGLFSGKKDVDYLSSVILGICSAYGKNELNILVDHRDMKTVDGEAVVYSPEVAEAAVIFQQKLTSYSNRVVALCNSEFMVQQLNHVTKDSGIHDKATHIFSKNKEMVDRAYTLLGIRGNELIK
ncbi:helix-turn-helix domain-containing protein [Paenibacillus sp. CAU 1782]